MGNLLSSVRTQPVSAPEPKNVVPTLPAVVKQTRRHQGGSLLSMAMCRRVGDDDNDYMVLRLQCFQYLRRQQQPTCICQGQSLRPAKAHTQQCLRHQDIESCRKYATWKLPLQAVYAQKGPGQSLGSLPTLYERIGVPRANECATSARLHGLFDCDSGSAGGGVATAVTGPVPKDACTTYSLLYTLLALNEGCVSSVGSGSHAFIYQIEVPHALWQPQDMLKSDAEAGTRWVYTMAPRGSVVNPIQDAQPGRLVVKPMPLHDAVVQDMRWEGLSSAQLCNRRVIGMGIKTYTNALREVYVHAACSTLVMCAATPHVVVLHHTSLVYDLDTCMESGVAHIRASGRRVLAACDARMQLRKEAETAATQRLRACASTLDKPLLDEPERVLRLLDMDKAWRLPLSSATACASSALPRSQPRTWMGVAMVMEACDQTFAAYVHRMCTYPRHAARAHATRIIALQTIQALATMYRSYGIAHNDCHASNVLLVPTPTRSRYIYTVHVDHEDMRYLARTATPPGINVCTSQTDGGSTDAVIDDDDDDGAGKGNKSSGGNTGLAATERTDVPFLAHVIVPTWGLECRLVDFGYATSDVLFGDGDTANTYATSAYHTRYWMHNPNMHADVVAAELFDVMRLAHSLEHCCLHDPEVLSIVSDIARAATQLSADAHLARRRCCLLPLTVMGHTGGGFPLTRTEVSSAAMSISPAVGADAGTGACGTVTTTALRERLPVDRAFVPLAERLLLRLAVQWGFQVQSVGVTSNSGHGTRAAADNFAGTHAVTGASASVACCTSVPQLPESPLPEYIHAATPGDTAASMKQGSCTSGCGNLRSVETPHRDAPRSDERAPRCGQRTCWSRACSPRQAHEPANIPQPKEDVSMQAASMSGVEHAKDLKRDIDSRIDEGCEHVVFGHDVATTDWLHQLRATTDAGSVMHALLQPHATTPACCTK